MQWTFSTLYTRISAIYLNKKFASLRLLEYMNGINVFFSTTHLYYVQTSSYECCKNMLEKHSFSVQRSVPPNGPTK